MAVKTNAQLAAYFNTGDKPTEGNFADLIDTIVPTPVVLADASANLTEAANAMRINILPDVASTSNVYDLPTPSAAGVWYRFIYGGAAEDAENHVFNTSTTDNSVYFKGSVAHVGKTLEGSETKNWGNLADGAQATEDVTVTGAAIGDYCVASLGVDIVDLYTDCAITATNTATVVLRNESTGAVDLAETTMTVLVTQAGNAAVLSDGNSNSALTSTDTAFLDLTFIAASTTVWYVVGSVISATPPAFADQ